VKRRSTGRTVRLLALVLAVIFAAGCTQTITGYASHGTGGIKKDAPPSDLPIVNGNGSAIDQLVANSMDDIAAYWDEHEEAVFDGTLEELQGGIHAYEVDGDMDIPCFDDSEREYAANNAFYCPTEDAIGYDRTFVQGMADQFGDFIVPLVMAHEFGHAIQARVGAPTNLTISAEGQADCYAGAFTHATVDGTAHFQATSADLDTVLGGYLMLRDEPGASAADPNAHGSAFDRVGAFQEGFNEGPEHCYTSFGEDREYAEIPYVTQNDKANAGNLPYEEMLTTIPVEMNKFGSVAAGDDWTEVPTESFEGTNTQCDGKDAQEQVFFCDAETSVFAGDEFVQQVYDKFGDFAAMTAIALGYGDAVQELTDSGAAGKSGFESRLCLVGAYAGAAFEATVSNKPSQLGDLQLSAGDLDEAVMLLIALLDNDEYIKTHGMDAFERIDTFRQAVIDSREDAIGTVETCLDV
jgi:predicted metalloprotease